MAEAVAISPHFLDSPELLYRCCAVAEACRSLEDITDDECRRFQEAGYLAIDRAFSQEQVEGALGALLDLLERRDRPGLYLEVEAGAEDPEGPPESRQDHVRKLMSFVVHAPQLASLSQDPRMNLLLTRLLGDRAELFQDMALIKPPRIGREKPWHQDLAYFKLPIETTVVGAWIALDPATVENGCMCLIPGSHRRPMPHFQRRDWQVCDSDVPAGRAVAVPLEPGGLLLFHGLVMHGTPPNRSSQRRRALQFHYKPAGATWTNDEQRLAVFGGEGIGAQC